MKSLKSSDDLNENVPHLLFRHVITPRLKLKDLVIEVSSVSILHYDTQTGGRVLIERLLIRYNVVISKTQIKEQPSY